MGPIVAKFRCLDVTTAWNGAETARLVPVMATETVVVDGAMVKRESPENARFWAATPTGEARIACGVYTTSERRDGAWVEVQRPYPYPAGYFRPGRTYWVHVRPVGHDESWVHVRPDGDEKSRWTVDDVTLRTSGSLRVSWSRGASSCSMSIENRGAIPLLAERLFEQFLAAARNPSGQNHIDSEVTISFEPTTGDDTQPG